MTYITDSIDSQLMSARALRKAARGRGDTEAHRIANEAVKQLCQARVRVHTADRYMRNVRLMLRD